MTPRCPVKQWRMWNSSYVSKTFSPLYQEAFKSPFKHCMLHLKMH